MSNLQPAQVINLGKGYLVNFNINEITVEDESGSHTAFEYDSVMVTKLDRAEIIQAIIRHRYSNVDDELALINNRALSAEKEQEYQDYQSWRNFAKTIADEAIQ